MKKTLYLECNSGISGDMTVGALLDLGADRGVLDKALYSLPVSGFRTKISRVKKSGLDACDFNVILEHDNHDHDMEYLHGHSYSTPATWAAMEAIGRKYSIPLVKEMHKRFGIIRPSRNWNKKPFPLEDQIKADLTECVIGDQEFLNNPISFLGTHCGYVDHELFQVSTYTLIRNQDLAAVTSERFKQWIQENNIEQIGRASCRERV